MSGYTPTTDQVRDAVRPYRVHPAEFDRWLAEHDREVAAKTCERLRAAIREALDFQAVLPAIATKPREILTKALEATS